MVEIDGGPAALRGTNLHKTGTSRIAADVRDYEFPDGQRFDVVGNFRCAYSYLDEEDAIRELVEQLVRWAAPGGARYLELTVGEFSEEFDESGLAAEATARAFLRSPDGGRRYCREGGRVHRTMNPRPDFFYRPVTPRSKGTGQLVVFRQTRQFVARCKRPEMSFNALAPSAFRRVLALPHSLEVP